MTEEQLNMKEQLNMIHDGVMLITAVIEQLLVPHLTESEKETLKKYGYTLRK